MTLYPISVRHYCDNSSMIPVVADDEEEVDIRPRLRDSLLSRSLLGVTFDSSVEPVRQRAGTYIDDINQNILDQAGQDDDSRSSVDLNSENNDEGKQLSRSPSSPASTISVLQDRTQRISLQEQSSDTGDALEDGSWEVEDEDWELADGG